MYKLFLFLGESLPLDDIYQFGKENTSLHNCATKGRASLNQGFAATISKSFVSKRNINQDSFLTVYY